MAGIEDLTNRGVEFAENFEMPESATTGLVRRLMQMYDISEREAMDMLQGGGQGPEIRPNTQGGLRYPDRLRQMPESELGLPKFNQG